MLPRVVPKYVTVFMKRGTKLDFIELRGIGECVCCAIP